MPAFPGLLVRLIILGGLIFLGVLYSLDSLVVLTIMVSLVSVRIPAILVSLGMAPDPWGIVSLHSLARLAPPVRLPIRIPLVFLGKLQCLDTTAIYLAL